jgi:general secretion pathway protein D
MVFLRPVVMRDARETSNLALDRYELMRAIQKDTQPLPSRVLGINEAPVLVPQRAPSSVLPPLGQLVAPTPAAEPAVPLAPTAPAPAQ